MFTIQNLRNMELMHVSRISFPRWWSPSPSCLLQSCCNDVVLPTRSTSALPCLHDYLAILNIQHLHEDAAQCFKTFHAAISGGKRGYRAHGAQTFRRVQDEDVQRGHPVCALNSCVPKIARVSTGGSLRIEHQRRVFQARRSLTGCCRIAIAKEILL